MEQKQTPVVKKSLFSWIFAENVKLQILLVIIIIITVFTRVVPLEMQKRVVNEAIKLRKLDLLLRYCGIYLVAVISASALKYLINIIQTVISERVLANMRKELYHHILTLPLNFFRKTQPGMVVSSLVTELTTAGNFAGMAVSAPVINIFTLLAFTGYLIWLNPLLGCISLSIYPIIVFLVPMLQKGANKANKKRVDISRTLSNRIGETITGIHEVHGNGSYRIENSKFDLLTDRLLKNRIIWMMYTQGIKVTNNFFTSLGPFLVFILGGYLAMKGQLELGALVAFLSAQEKLYDPWKELIEFYQVYQDASVRYTRTMEYFDAMPEHALEPADRPPYDLDGNIEVRDLSFATEDGISLLSDITFSLKPGETLALVGFSGSGKSTLAQCIGQLYKYTGGHVYIGNKEVSELSKKDIVRNIGFVSQSPFTFDGTIEENLLYSYAAIDEGNGESRIKELNLDDKISVLQQTGIFVDVLRFGLNTLLDYDLHGELVSKLIRVRKNFKQEFGEDLAAYVEFFNKDRYLYYSSIVENLTFGTANRASFADNNLLQNPYFLEFLNKADLTRPLLGLSADLARQTINIIGNLPHEVVFFEQSPITPGELDEYKELTERLKKTKLHQISPEDQKKLLDLALRFTPGKHKMIELPALLEKLILEGRAMFTDKISTDDPEAISFFQMSEYIYSQTILNNILFGKTKTDNPQVQERIYQSIVQLLIEEDFLESIIEIGMQYQVGSKGENLSGGQRQKLAIARTFIKKPKILIMDEATSALDNASQTRIQKLLDTRWKGKNTLISVVHRLDIVKDYDRIAVMKAGKIAEMGPYEELMKKEGTLYELVRGKK